MTTTGKPERAQAHIAAALVIIGFLLPGVLFEVLLAINQLFDLRPLSTSHLMADIGSLVTAGGFLSLITTPVGLICTWSMRKRLNTVAGTVVKTAAAIALLGWVGFVLTYANPFFIGA